VLSLLRTEAFGITPDAHMVTEGPQGYRVAGTRPYLKKAQTMSHDCPVSSGSSDRRLLGQVKRHHSLDYDLYSVGHRPMLGLAPGQMEVRSPIGETGGPVGVKPLSSKGTLLIVILASDYVIIGAVIMYD